MDRRDFIKLTAISGTTATLASCGNPEHQLIRFVPDDDVVPGVAEWKPSVCPLCAAGCGVTVRVMDADVDTVRNGQAGVVAMAVAKKLEGDPNHPVNRGGLCARGQAAIQITYHPDRLRQPMKRTGARGTGEFTAISWDEAISELVSKVDALAAAGEQNSLVCLTGRRRGMRIDLWAAFAKGFRAPAPIVFEPLGDDVLRRANALSFGRDQLPTFDFARSNYVIAFGADVLGTWNSPVAQSAAYGAMRQSRPQRRGKLVQVEARMSLTGANADEWIPARPGTEGVVALGLVHLLMKAERPGDAATRAGALIDGWSSGLSDYAPERVEQIAGVPARRLERIAGELAEFRPAVAVVGGPPLAHTNGLFTALAVNSLNGLLGAVEQPGGVFFTPVSDAQSPGAAVSAAEQSRDAAVSTPGQSRSAALSGPRSADVKPALQSTVDRLAAAKVLLIDQANPVYGAPKVVGIRETLEKVPFIASFASFVDDTSAFADLILPDHSFLESWVASAPESGALEAVRTSAGPVMKPLHQTRATADVLIEVAGKLKSPIALPWKSAEELAKAPATSGESTGRLPSSGRPGNPARVEGRSVGGLHRYEAPRFDGDPSAYPFHFLPYASVAFGDGSSAHLPWLQEMPDPLTSAMWSSWVELNPQTAARLGIAQGDVVEIGSTHGSIRAPAMLFPGIAPDVVAMPIGQGHDTFTRFASKRGANPIAILAAITEPETGALAWAATRVKVARISDPDASLIMFAGEMRERPHERDR
jgi:anaerobic selenocysteine-containing dehydrogenase